MKNRISRVRVAVGTLLILAAALLCIAAFAPSAVGFLKSQSEGPDESEARGDQPDERARFRRLQLQDENGNIPADGLLKAKAHVDRMRATQKERAKGTTTITRMETANIEPDNWTWLGPGNVGGRIRSIVIDPENANSMWVGSVTGGISLRAQTPRSHRHRPDVDWEQRLVHNFGFM